MKPRTTAVGEGTPDGWYTVQFKTDRLQHHGDWIDSKGEHKPTYWHFAADGKSRCGAHNRPTKVSREQMYITTQHPPLGAKVCGRCA
jgi:hypothetical protein